MYHKLICTGLSPSMIAFSKTFHFVYYYNIAVLLPHKCRNNRGLGCSPVARHYWGNHCCFIFLQVLRCFSSLRLLTRIHNSLLFASIIFFLYFQLTRIPISLLCLLVLIVVVVDYISINFPACQRTMYVKYQVENKGVEPLTSCVQSRRSSQLS